MYKPISSSWEWYRSDQPENTPISTAHNEMERGREVPPKPVFKKKKMLQLSFFDWDKLPPIVPHSRKKMLSFQTFDPEDGRFRMGSDFRKNPVQLTTSYNTTFKPRVSASKCKPKETAVSQPAPDFLWNRRSKSVFHCNPWNEHKFMDDQFTLQPAGAKKIDFFRQLRNASFEKEKEKIEKQENQGERKTENLFKIPCN